MSNVRCFIWILFAACAHHASPTNESPRSASITGRIAVIDSATGDTAGGAQLRDSIMDALRTRFDSLAALVDTVELISPDSVVLSVGQEVEVLGLIRTQARRRSGEVLPIYPGNIVVEDTAVAKHQEYRLTGVSPGRTRVILRIASTSAHAAPTYVPIVVIP